MKFAYSAYDQDGKSVSGVFDGANEIDVISQLSQRGLLIYSTAPATDLNKLSRLLNSDIGRRTPSLSQRVHFCRALHALNASSVPIDRALLILSTGSTQAWLSKLGRQCHEAIVAGKSLSEALSDTTTGFSRDEVGLIAAGEQTGAVSSALNDLASLLEHRLLIRQHVTSALVYPAVLIIMAVLSLAIIASVLIPAVAPLLVQSNVDLPVMFRAMMAVQEAVQHNGGSLLAGTLALGLLIAGLIIKSKSRPFASDLRLRFPLSRDAEAARIYRTLGTLLRNKVPVQRAVQLTSNAVKNQAVANDLHRVAEAVMTGKSLANSLSKVRVVDQTAVALVTVGEETNKVPEILMHLAKQTEQKVTHRIDRALTLLTPVLTIGLGLLIGGLIVSVMRAIMSINDVAGAL
jgi:general secretion pathway protein F